jgi:DNA (cytosine-5)-methyltransferase 1
VDERVKTLPSKGRAVAVRPRKKVYRAISLFSGAMGLDLGLERAGIDVSACVELDKYCCQTIRLNRPRVSLFEKSIGSLHGGEIVSECGLEPEATILVGGPPCQSFSSAGNRAGLSDSRGNLIFEYFRILKEVKPTAFIFENVGNLLTAALRHRPIALRPGKHWNLKRYSDSEFMAGTDGVASLSPDEQSGSAFKYLLREILPLDYTISFGILNSADFGSPQKRIRFIMLGTRGRPRCPLPSPTHGEYHGQPYATLRDAIFDLRDDPGAHSSYTKRIADCFRKIPAGGNWRNLNPRSQRAILGGSFGAGGGKTGFMRRLSWDKPAPTLTTKANRKGTALCHPDFIRPLSVREYARIQGFPDDWEFAGAMNQIYQQIGNAVPTALGFAVGMQLKRHLESTPKGSAIQKNDEGRLLVDYELALRKLRSYARNTQGSNSQQQLALSCH